MEFIQGLIAGYLLSNIGLIALVLVGICFAANESKFISGLLAIAAIWVAAQLFPLKGAVLWTVPPAYFMVGIAWSIWRYRRHANDIVERYQHAAASVRKDVLHRLRPNQMLGDITCWAFIWPFSMVASLVGDTIKLVQHAIKAWFSAVYESIFNSAAAKLADEKGTNEII